MNNGQQRRIAQFATGRLLPVLALFVLPFIQFPAFAQEAVCARVVIEIKQELTLERQAFDAQMKINNGLTTDSLSEVSVVVKVTDELGVPVLISSDPNNLSAKFFVRISSISNIANVDGTGVVAPASTATINWLIIPAPGSAGGSPLGKKYLVGATLQYKFGSETQTVTVSPDVITVKPLPLLTLDYFLTQDVVADNPFTAAIEPTEPFTLGVRVKNTGQATAKNLTIDSAQPKIIENNQGLLINFKLTGSYVNDAPVANTLLINFGDILASKAKMGRWVMETTLAGRFTDFTAKFSHADELGGALTSIMQATNAHFLIRDVRVDLPGRDTVRDFLARDGDVIRVYESDSADTEVNDRSGVATLVADTGATGNARYRLSFPATAGFAYVKLPDPFGGQKALGQVVRSDAKTMLPENVWLSKNMNPQTNVWNYWINFFDVNTPGVYSTEFKAPPIAAKPPVIQFVADHTVKEGDRVSFLVEASSPDGKPVTLSAPGLPTGATLVAQAPQSGTATSAFDWTPAKGQAGKYPITFSASDGTLNTTASASITVTTAIAPAGPDMPQIAAPQVGTEVNVLNPAFAIAASRNALDTVTSYHLQVFADAGMQSLVAEKLGLPLGTTGKTVWTVPLSLADNTMYYWRVRASDGTTYSSWAVGRFFVNTVNEAPTAPLIASPSDGATVAVTAPVLSITNSTDPEGDAVIYGFEVFSDSLLTQKVAEVASLATSSVSATNWTVTPALSDATQYFWRATATDTHGARTVSATGNFRVDTSKSAPAAPVLVSPAAGSALSVNSAALTVANSLRPGGMVLNYFFELGRSPTFASPDVVRSGALAEGSINTAFTATGLVENARYFWRVKLSDGVTESLWTYGDFVVDASNDAPSVPDAINPGNAAWVATTTPLFTLAPSLDAEGDALAYRIEIYSDAALTNKLVDHLTSNLSWLLDVPLTDNSRYYWRVRAEDARGELSTWSPTSAFLVRTGSSGSMMPVLALTSPVRVVNVPAITTAAPSASVNISWEIDDPLNNSRVVLYYDSDRLNANGTLIVGDLAQDPSSRLGSYSWNVSALAPGSYYIYAIVSNSAGTMTRYAPGAFVVPVSAPRGVVTVTPVGVMETTEAGGQATFSVVLGNSPKADVSIGLSSTKPTEALVDKQQLVFNTANWNIPQTVTVTGQPDCINDGDVGYQVIVSKAISSDADYNGIKGADLSLLNRSSTVGCPGNNSPLANAGPAQLVDAGSTVALNGSGTDSDGTISSYAWVQTAGTAVVLADATKAVTSFTAPLPLLDTQLTFQLTVTDNLGATGTASVNVVVKKSPNQPPTASAGSAQTVISGSTVNLTGSGTDSDGTITSYLWTQIAGVPISLADASSARTSFIAPLVTVSTALGFRLTLTDNIGATASATVLITVLPNQEPAADAGADQTVDEGSSVTLSGSGTDSDGTVVTYFWAQTAGPNVTLTNANTATAYSRLPFPDHRDNAQRS